jgi:hypothetical protein
MNRRKTCLFAAMAAAVSLAGCGDGFDESTRFNRALGGGTASVPVSGSVDVSILVDPANYTPAQFDPIVGGADPGSAGAAAADANPEVAAIQDLSRRMQTALINGEIDALLDCFPDDKIKALRDSDFVASADELATNVRGVWRLVVTKSAGTDLEVISQAPQLITMVLDLAQAGERVEIINETEARLVPDADRLQARAVAMRPQLIPAFDKFVAAIPGSEGMTGEMIFDGVLEQMLGGAEIGAGTPGLSELSRVIKVDGEWRRDLPVTFTDEHAEALNGAVLVVNDFLDQVHDRIDALDKLDTQSLEQLQGQLMVPALALVGQLTTELQPLMGEFAGDIAAVAAVGSGPSFSEDILPIMIDRCLTCHELEPEQAFGFLHDNSSAEDDALKLLVPGDVEASYVFTKLTQDKPPHGKRMPAKGGPLTDDEIELFRRWIEAGALNDLTDSSEESADGDDDDGSGRPRVRGAGGG